LGGDRLNLDLPESQRSLLRHLRSLKKPLILVLTGGSPITVAEEVELADAALFVWYPGCEGGKAVADVIFGDVNPSGRMPVTFPLSTADLPPFEDYSMRGRTYRYSDRKALYPFGFGLSYTSFAYTAAARTGSGIEARVANTGKRDGEEVVQVYVRDPKTDDRVPNHRLVAFKRVFVPAGESVNVEFELGAEALGSGETRVWIGGGQPDLAPGAWAGGR
jgi:beta-glucosidase